MNPIDIARALFEQGWNQQDFTNVNRLLADELPLHIGGTTTITNAADLEAIVARWHAAFPDLHFDIHSITADHFTVAVRATLHGTHNGPWGNVEATGRTIAIEHAFFLHIENGVIAEVWEVLDQTALIAQLSASTPT